MRWSLYHCATPPPPPPVKVLKLLLLLLVISPSCSWTFRIMKGVLTNSFTEQDRHTNDICVRAHKKAWQRKKKIYQFLNCNVWMNCEISLCERSNKSTMHHIQYDRVKWFSHKPLAKFNFEINAPVISVSDYWCLFNVLSLCTTTSPHKSTNGSTSTLPYSRIDSKNRWQILNIFITFCLDFS